MSGTGLHTQATEEHGPPSPCLHEATVSGKRHTKRPATAAVTSAVRTATLFNGVHTAFVQVLAPRFRNLGVFPSDRRDSVTLMRWLPVGPWLSARVEAGRPKQQPGDRRLGPVSCPAAGKGGGLATEFKGVW